MSKGKEADTSSNSLSLSEAMPLIASFLEKGTRAFALADWPQAIEHFGQMAAITEQAFGSESPRYADSLVMYGRALLQYAIEQSAILAQNTLAQAVAGTTDESNEASSTMATNAKITFEGEPDFRQVEETEDEQKPKNEKDKSDEEDGGEGEEDDEDGEETDDFGAAWDILDLARVIQSKATDRASQLKYAETLMLLGDVSMETENFAQAQEDYTQALSTKLQYLEDDDRQLAELYYKVALAHEYNKDTEGALKLMEDVQRILNNRLEKAEDEEEKSGLREVLDDVKEKIDEWKMPKNSTEQAADDVGSEMIEKAKEMFAKAVESGKINDLTALVKMKKKTKDDVQKRSREEGEETEDTEATKKARA
ncbi:hypothetical protein GGI07_003030 [Coemansia sp. Benny D115]|nr:hypothetical protein GGI07_003030 [Coemansia sp. Benny D115]